MVKRGLILGGIITLFASFVPLDTFAADAASSTFSIDVQDAALQVTAPATASIVLNPTSSSAVFGSTNITVNVATNNTTGYTITMSVPTTDLTHSEITGNNAPVIPTLQSAAPQSTFPSNAWGYKVTGDNYNPVQLTNTNPSWQTENPTNGTDHIIGLAAKVDGTKHSGTYTNTLTFNVVTNPNAIRDTIIFNKNNENATGTMENQYVYQGNPAKLNKNQYQVSGKRFTGWSTTASGTGEGTRYYGDESSITSEIGETSKTIILYAQWTSANFPACVNPGDCEVDPEHIPEGGTTGVTFQRAYEIAYTAMGKGMYEETEEGNGIYEEVTDDNYKSYDVRFAMQDMTPEICASVTAMHDDYRALDIRDNKLYHITKMKDGSCWMTQNLDLDLQHDRVLTHADTDLGWTDYDAAATWNPSTTANTKHFEGTVVDGWIYQNDGYKYPQSASPGEIYHYPISPGSRPATGHDIEYSSLEECNIAQNIDCSHWHTGNYYSFAAAVASNDVDRIGQESVPNSICPSGWKLPSYANGTNDYGILLKQENIIENSEEGHHEFLQDGFEHLMKHPLYFVRGGTVSDRNYDDYPNDTNLIDASYVGEYWIGMAGWKDGAWRFTHSGSVGDGYNRYIRFFGLSVRCLAR